MAKITNIVCTSSKEIDIQSGTGNINIGTVNADNNIVIGNLGSTGNNNLTLVAGTITGGGVLQIGAGGDALVSVGSSVTTSETAISSGTGGIFLLSGTGPITIGTPAASNKTITIGSTGTGATACPLILQSGTSGTSFSSSNGTFSVIHGTGSITIGADATNKTINLGSTSSSSTLSIDTGSGALNIGNTTAKTITIGNTTGATAVNVNTGTGGSVYTTTNGVFTVATGTGTVSISGDAAATTVGLATGGGAKALTLGSTNTTSSVTVNTGSGGITIPSFSSYGALVSTSAGVITDAAAGTSGFVLTSNGTSSLPTFQANAGGGIGTINGNTGSVTGATISIVGAGTVTTSGSGTTLTVTGTGGITWNDQTTSTVTIVASNAYIMDDGATLITATLPTTAALGAEFKIVGKAAGLWTIAQNSGQSIVFGNTTTTTGVSGSLSSTLASDCVSVVCTTANNVFTVYNAIGNLTVV